MGACREHAVRFINKVVAVVQEPLAARRRGRHNVATTSRTVTGRNAAQPLARAATPGRAR
eukprot:4372963-Alexandrium_andersonii.AAC.1